ncbi:MAG: sprT domain-containing protein [Planctomycetota bacterium]|nr:sprT domain-containing protein [Planctomycetota bacterium]
MSEADDPYGIAIQRHLPTAAGAYVSDLLAARDVVVRVSRPRLTKLGDHRPPRPAYPHHRISVNADLNPYAFLTTLLHEIAHVDVWTKHAGRRRRPKPHGLEWKYEFAGILAPVVTAQWLPADVASALNVYMQNPAAMSCSDRGLVLALARYDSSEITRHRVEDIPLGAIFRVSNGRIFCRGQRMRTRYLCVDPATGVEYRVHALAIAEPLAGDDVNDGRWSGAAAVGRRGNADGGRCCRRHAAADTDVSRSACS